MFVSFLIVCLVAAVIPCVLFCANLRRYVPPPAAIAKLPAVSILIPARNEAEGIADAIGAALATRGVEFELVIMDDGSTDGTAAIVRSFAARDVRVRLEQAPPLPAGWNGKQHACWSLALAARSPLLCFVDADVRLAPDCVARMATFLLRPAGPAALVSGFPRQITGTFLERLLIPLIHFVLLGFLPMGRMRGSTNPGFAAGCGQFFLANREAYFAVGGHSGIPLTMHDGLRLPRLFREHGYRTDLADITELASVRMYTNARDTWQGLAKNATEGLGAPGRIVPITLILLLGQVVPFVVFAAAIAVRCSVDQLLVLFFGMPVRFHGGIPAGFAAHPRLFLIFLIWAGVLPWLFVVMAAWLPRMLAARRFRQSWVSALLHPVGIVLLLGVQWYALLRKVTGAKVSWRGRAYAKPSA